MDPTAPAGTAPGLKKRITISDIAERAGVTAAAVSLAINGRPGVSDTTRARILAIADELNWRPSHAARALAGANVGCIGMVWARPAEVIGSEAFFGSFMAGLQEVLSSADYSVQMKIVKDTAAEIATYGRWFSQRRVDGVVMLDLKVEDPRIPVLEELGRPALVIGGPGHHGSLPAIYVDDAQAMYLVMEHLTERGHRRIAHVTGTPDFLHTAQRHAAFAECCAERGVEGIERDASAAGAEAVTRELLALPQPPTAVIYDSDEQTLAGTAVMRAEGVAIPEDVAVVSFEDSRLMELYQPSITAIARSAVDYGRAAGHRILQMVGAAEELSTDERRSGSEAEIQVLVPSLTVRASTGS